MRISKIHILSLFFTYLLVLGNSFSQTRELNEDSDILIEKIVQNRIELQESFEINPDKDFINIYNQTLALEESLAEYFYTKSSDTITPSASFNPQIVLARMIYINARTWCMTEPLKKRTDYLFSTEKSENIEVTNGLLKLSQLTNRVDSDIERAKRFDRLKYRYNSSIVVSNWEHTVDRLKILSKDLNSLDSEYQKSYRTMLSDLYSMIGILDMYKAY